MTERDDVKPEPSAEEIERVAWPPLKKALWGVVTGEALNGGRYVNAYDLTDKLHAAILALDSRASPPAPAVAVPDEVEDLLERLDGGVRISGEMETDDGVIELMDIDDAQSAMAEASEWIRAHLAAAPEPPASPPPAVCDVMTMQHSSGFPEHFARVTVGRRWLTFFMSRIKGQAEYHAAEFAWLLNGSEKPDILAFDYTEPAGLSDYLAARATPPAQEVKAEPVAWAEMYSGRVASVSLSGGRHHAIPLYLASPSHADDIRQGLERAAKLVEGEPYGECSGRDGKPVYRTWAHWPTLPDGSKGNRGVDDFLVQHCDALAAAIRALAKDAAP